ncbi:unnamed protein product [Cyprideis torosa]|uniref:Uncharacterized protein n=1 Tax=Cyprideis torosa TaxID=163714 RepID=A0A7R8ZTL7_9CRUS|nr:unnamed protein product [Cyprideis torosa]CAG0907776.1 unnamed protein product [Cyprideis torosa]
MQALSSKDLSQIEYYHFTIGDFAGIEDVIISATGYTGAGGFELYFASEAAPKVWDAVMKAGEKYGIEPCGLASRDSLRLEKAYCLYGNDIDETRNTLEAGLGWVTKMDTDFIGKPALEKIKSEGLKHKLIAFEIDEKGIPRPGYPILSQAGQEIGQVTSGGMSPILGKGIGLGYVAFDQSQIGHRINIEIRGKQVPAKIVKAPFV